MKNLTFCGLAFLLVLKVQAQEAAAPEQDRRPGQVIPQSTAPVPLTVGTFVGAGFPGAIDHAAHDAS